MSHSSEVTLEGVTAWENLLLAWHKAARGKRGKPGVAAFEHPMADRLLLLQSALPGLPALRGRHGAVLRLEAAALRLEAGDLSCAALNGLHVSC
jgi:hypothetical protein